MSRLTISKFRAVLVAAAAGLLALPALADTQARIVRLSDVQGSVQIDKNAGAGFESAFLNLPITEGAQIKTGDRGRAEIEFEDGSTLRLAPNTAVQLNTLGVNDAGKHNSVINLVDGMAYVNWLAKGGDTLILNFSREKVALDHSAHFRVETSTAAANLAVFKGNVEAEGPGGKVAVEKKKTATFDGTDNDKSAVANKVEEQPLDSWDKEANNYHDEYARNNNSSPYGYGMSDLNYYGAFSNVSGYGMMWQPYFAGAGFDPFMDGAWSFYPGYGFMFASAYPWGWMPYRYGNWVSVPGMGWMWQPGGWNSWLTVPRYTGITPVNFHPLVVPAAGTVRPVVVGRSTLATSVHSPRMVVNAGSAGLGIPRGSLGNLKSLNHEVVKTGSAQVRTVPQFAATSGRTAGFGSTGRTGSASGSSGRSAPVSAPRSTSSSHVSTGGGTHR